ncbi:NUDIX domain-containing protein [Pseudonocardia lacus]|uniref:NUDIX domain-containing protein n=1 Tax=Pseudonocardia lacus TaxID=2835865 RepID=UPI001BDDC777|nr:NUDIX hydrolase [Pseudonocardia lacus]
MTEAVIRQLRERIVHENRFATVYDDVVSFPDGRVGEYLRVVEGGGRPGAAVLAVCGERVALVHVYRYPLGEWEWAVPRGFGHCDDPMETALNELVEELGAAPAELVDMGRITPNSGLLAGDVQLAFARYKTEVAAPVDVGEVRAVRWVDLAALGAEITSGAIRDGFTLSALAAAALRGFIRL